MRIGTLELETPLLLAPIAGYCDLAFRHVVRRIRGPAGGVGLASTDLLCPEAILRQTHKTQWLASTDAADQPLCMQLYGRHPDVLVEAGRWAEAHGASVVDVNMGCPVDKVTKKNGGSKLLCEPGLAVEIVRSLVRALRVPVTAKIRLGWDAGSLIVETLPRALADVGAAAVTVHGRTTAQRFRGEVSLEGIGRVVASVKRSHPQTAVIGNGDVRSGADAAAMMRATGCDGVMIGRGALAEPWIFREAAAVVRGGEAPAPLSQSERAAVAADHVRELRRLRGETAAVKTMSQRMSWYSPALQPWPGLRRSFRAMNSTQQMLAYLEAGAPTSAGGRSAEAGRPAPAGSFAG